MKLQKIPQLKRLEAGQDKEDRSYLEICLSRWDVMNKGSWESFGEILYRRWCQEELN